MTETRLEELLDAMGLEADGIVPVDSTILTNRAELVKYLWNKAVIDAPPGATEGGDGLVLMVDDPTRNGFIIYEKITYGDKKVIKSEGVVVCHLIG